MGSITLQLGREEFIKKISTRELLNARYDHRGYDGFVNFSRMGIGGVPVTMSYTVDEIYEELSDRPHIHRKNDGRAPSKLKKKRGKK